MMVQIEEGLHVYNEIVKETGIDPYERPEGEMQGNRTYQLAIDNLRKLVRGEAEWQTKTSEFRSQAPLPTVSASPVRSTTRHGKSSDSA